MSENIRLINYDELSELLDLYKQLQPNDPDVYENSEFLRGLRYLQFYRIL